MQRCLVQWVSSGKKPSGHPADRGMACWRGACCSLTERGASGGRGPRYRGSRWILAPLLDRKPRAMPCRFVRASDPLSPSARVRSSRMERELEIEKVSADGPLHVCLGLLRRFSIGRINFVSSISWAIHWRIRIVSIFLPLSLCFSRQFLSS